MSIKEFQTQIKHQQQQQHTIKAQQRGNNNVNDDDFRFFLMFLCKSRLTLKLILIYRISNGNKIKVNLAMDNNNTTAGTTCTTYNKKYVICSLIASVSRIHTIHTYTLLNFAKDDINNKLLFTYRSMND